MKSDNKLGAPTRIAIIEDDAGLRDIFSGWLADASGLELASQFMDAESALEALPTNTPDVALVDINLPGMDGIECVARLKPQLPRTQFIMVTVYEDAERIFRALAAGATGYLLKRASREELLAAIDEVQRGGSPMTSNIARKVVQSFSQTAPAMPEDTQLSAREQQVLRLMAQGYVSKEIAVTLSLALPTVNSHIRHIYEKLQVHSRTQAVMKYLGK